MTNNRKLYLAAAGAALFSISAIFGAFATPQDKTQSCDYRCLSECRSQCDPSDVLCRDYHCYRACGCIVP